ncbi:MAG: DUF3352 domain-containing protein [Acidobacteria bacterium]|nr:DUF3352 domain-containing protein [Acidobacteriota bacterium]
MEFRRLLTTKNMVILVVVFALLTLSVGYLVSRKPPRLAMAKFVPANALAYIEINSLTEVLDGLTETKAWDEIAPVLGLSGQLKQLGSGIGWMSRTGLGPDEVVIAGRAQYAIIVTAIEAGTGANDEGVYLHVKPRFALLVETHASNEKATKLANERAAILANRIFGEGTREESTNYQGVRLITFHGAQAERQLVAAAFGSKVLIANHESAIKSCLDTMNGQTASLAEDETLNRRRSEVDQGSAIFAYVTTNGIEKLAQFGPAIFASRFTNNPDALSAVANLFGRISKQTADGWFYSLAFADGEVLEKTLTALRPPVARGLQEATKPATGASFKSLQWIPKEAEECTILNMETVGALPEKILQQLSPQLDLVAGLALREFVIQFRKNLGIEASENLGNLVGPEIALVKLTPDEPVLMLIQVQEAEQLMPAVNHYLSEGKVKISSASYNGVELHLSLHEDGRAAMFIEGYLALGTASQLKRILDTRDSRNTFANDVRVTRSLATRPPNAALIAFEADQKKAGELMLAISKLTRVSDGSKELLEQEAMKKALAKLPLSTSFTNFNEAGVFTQTRSAIGIFKRLSDWLE